MTADKEEMNLILQIPQDSEVKEYAIVPIGVYEGRHLTLYDYYNDENGQKQSITGTWKINDKAYTGDTADFSSTIPYSVEYQYNADEYFFVSSKPECFTQNATSGVINFHKASGLHETQDYSVELHPYIQADVPSNEKHIQSVLVNGKKDAFPCKLKFGDTITLQTSSDYRVSCNQVNMEKPEKLSDGYRFTVTITEDIVATKLLFQSKEWSSKDIAFELPKQSIWQKIVGLFSDKAEDSLLTVKSGQQELTYKALKIGKTITLNESDTLEIRVGEEIKDSPNLAFLISVNGANPVYITKATEEKSIALRYDEVESIRISIERGYVFSSANINNGALDVKYYVNGAKEVKEGQFLPEGTQVTVKVMHCPPDMEITDSAVKAGSDTGVVTVTDKTKSSDFVVNSRKNENT